MRLNTKKITTSGLWVTLLMQLGCCASNAPVVIMNVANPFFDPKHQIAACTGSLEVPVSSTVASINYSGPNWSTASNNSFTRTAVQSAINTSYRGFLLGSLVANGYSTNLVTATNATQPFSLALSGASSLNTPTVTNAAYAMAGYTVGLADLAQLCQLYGAYTAFINSAVGTTSTLYESVLLNNSNNIMTLPLSSNISLIYHIGLPFLNGNNIVLYGSPPSWNGSNLARLTTNWFWYNDGSATSISAYTLIPAILPTQQATILLSILSDPFFTNAFHNPAGIYDTPANLPSCVNVLSCVSGPLSSSSSFPPTFTVLQNPLPQFAQLQQWFTTNVNMQFSLANNGFPSPLSSSLVSMNGAQQPGGGYSSVTAAQPCSSAYSNMIASVFATPASVAIGAGAQGTSATANFAAPATLGTYEVAFYPEPLFVPLMMADPLWVAQAVSNKPVPYEYPNMKMYEWGRNNQWVLEEIPTQKISCAGDPSEGFGGGMGAVTDFNPQKSPMSDYYSMLSF